jgi:hypothetical protein
VEIVKDLDKVVSQNLNLMLRHLLFSRLRHKFPEVSMLHILSDDVNVVNILVNIVNLVYLCQLGSYQHVLEVYLDGSIFDSKLHVVALSHDLEHPGIVSSFRNDSLKFYTLFGADYFLDFVLFSQQVAVLDLVHVGLVVGYP